MKVINKNGLRLVLCFSLFMLLSGCQSWVSGGEKIAVKPGDGSEAEKATRYAEIAPLITAPVDGRPVRVYKVAFDGTMNDREKVPLGERATMVARIARLINANHYYPGAGMQGVEPDIGDAMTGKSSKGLALKATNDFYAVAQQWHREDPNAEIRIFITGFSRGAATAREFMNQVNKIWPEKFPAFATDLPHFYAMLYDTVSTGQKETLDLRLPSNVDYLVHFVATDEARNILFTPTVDVFSLKPDICQDRHKSGIPARINTIYLPGAHSDVGTSYSEGIGDLYIILSEKFIYMLGLNKTHSWGLKDDPLLKGRHDSRGLMDKLFAAPDPGKFARIARAEHHVQVKPQSPTRHAENQHRLQKMQKANAERASSLSTSRIEAVTANFTVVRIGADFAVKDVSPDVDLASVSISRGNGGYNLRFRLMSSMARANIFLNKAWLSKIGKTPVPLAYTWLITSDKTLLALWVGDQQVSIKEVKKTGSITIPVIPAESNWRAQIGKPECR